MAAFSPTVRHRRLTAELRRLREESRRTIDQVAQDIGISKSALSRIENGLVGIKLPVLRALLTEYSVTGEHAAALEQLCREAAQRGWWQVGETSDDFKTLLGLEAEATWINYFATSVITGLLQTEAYARALLTSILFDATEEELELAVRLRLKRQERLGEFRLWVIMAEEGLERPIGGSTVMAEQIDHLVETSRERSITIQIIGKEVGQHVGLGGGFEMIGLDSPEPEAVYVEGARWDACIEDRELLNIYSQAFERLRADALSIEESRTRMRTIAEGMRS